jgi:hypothetical protein
MSAAENMSTLFEFALAVKFKVAVVPPRYALVEPATLIAAKDKTGNNNESAAEIINATRLNL